MLRWVVIVSGFAALVLLATGRDARAQTDEGLSATHRTGGRVSASQFWWDRCGSRSGVIPVGRQVRISHQ
jgi:hypothetical protein